MIPHFNGVDFVSYYIEIPIMIFMYLVWLLRQRIARRLLHAPVDAEAATSISTSQAASRTTSAESNKTPRHLRWFDLVDTKKVDLYRDEHEENEGDIIEDQERTLRLASRWGWLWRVYYLVA